MCLKYLVGNCIEPLLDCLKIPGRLDGEEISFGPSSFKL